MKSERYGTFIDGNESPIHRPQLEHAANHTPESSSEQHLVRSYIKSLDEDCLRDIFNHYFQKSGSAPETMNFFRLSDIQVVNKTDGLVGFYGIDEHGVRFIVLDASVHADNPILLLHTLVHEQLHAATDAVNSSNGGSESNEHTLFKAGFERTSAGDTTNNSSPTTIPMREFTPANEGFTEYLTAKICDEYLARTGDSTWYGADNITKAKEQLFIHKYSGYTLRVKAYMRLVEFLTETPIDAVEGSMIRAYFRNSDILDEEVTTVLSAIDDELPLMVHLLLNSPRQNFDPTIVFDIVRDKLPPDDYEKRDRLYDIQRQILLEEIEYRQRRSEYIRQNS